ncbi:Cro/CI family transcriptional regulator [Ramlibacter sp. AN1015]|uniref:transcriptional regulator n=1 Tax=Ramlibacter sp. AN1015 TaxID=3133428 RepID=UPI0030BB0DC8
MKLSEYLKDRGSRQAFAEKLGVPAPLVSQWANGDRPVPIERCVQIETATDGKVRRWDLRADWLQIWPELERRKGMR